MLLAFLWPLKAYNGWWLTVTMKMKPGTLQTTNIITYLLALYLPILISANSRCLIHNWSFIQLKDQLILSNVSLMLPRTCVYFDSPSLRKFRNLNICKIQQPKQSVGNWKNVMPQRIRRYPNKGSDYSILLTITSNWSRRIGTLIAESK